MGRAGGGWMIRAALRNNAGVVEQLGATDTDFAAKDDAGWCAPAFVSNGTKLELPVVDEAATTFNWSSQTEAECV